MIQTPQKSGGSVSAVPSLESRATESKPNIKTCHGSVAETEEKLNVPTPRHETKILFNKKILEYSLYDTYNELWSHRNVPSGTVLEVMAGSGDYY